MSHIQKYPMIREGKSEYLELSVLIRVSAYSKGSKGLPKSFASETQHRPIQGK
jgi:hypothetical protein